MTSSAFAIFILTLAGDEARRASLTAWLAERGLDFELFFGVDGRSGLAPEWERQIDRDAAARRLGRQMGNCEYACALSHQEIYRTILERNLPGGIVLEDDVQPTEQFVEFVREQAYLQAEMILLGHSNTWVSRSAPTPLLPGVVGHRVAFPPFGTTGYSVSRAAAKFLRDASLPISGTADWPCDIAEFGAVAALPRLVGHLAGAEAQSHIALERSLRDPDQKGRFLTLAYWRRWGRKRMARRV